MKKIDLFYLSASNKMLAGLLTLLGFSVVSCNTTEEYGCPYADYKIKGKVVDEEGSPIPGIQVITPDPWNEYGYLQADTVISNNSGEFTTQPPTSSFGDDITFKVTAKDIDGEANGGLFEEKETEVTFQKEDLKGASGNWFYGSAEKNVTIILKKNS